MALSTHPIPLIPHRLGDLHESNVPQVFDELLSGFATPPVSPLWTLPLSPPHWRGRMGLDKEEQLDMLTRV